MKALLALALIAACGGSTMMSPPPGGDDDVTPDGNPQPPPPEGSIRITGSATERGFAGTSPVEGVITAAFSRGDDATPLATTTTDADGNFTLDVALSGGEFDGYIKATAGGYVDLYFYPTDSLTADYSDASFNMITPGNMGQLSSIANGNQEAGKGLIGLLVADGADQPIAGATVSCNPMAGRYRYMGGNGFPSSSATSTADDGVAFMFSVPAGEVTITATKSGTAFHSHVVKAWPDAFTSTAITP